MRIVFDEDRQSQKKPIDSRMRSIFTWIKACLILIPVTFLLYLYVTADPPNYCAEQKRYVPDGEYLQKKIKGLMKSGRMKLGPSDISVEAYLANHPHCCSVAKKDLNFFETILNFYPIEVYVSYEMSEEEYKRHKSTTETYYLEVQDMSACGKYGERGGFTEEAPKPEKRP